MSKLGTEHGYLIDYDNSGIIASRIEGGYLIAVSIQERDTLWDLTVIRRKDTMTDQYIGVLVTNNKSMSLDIQDDEEIEITSKEG